MILTTTRTRLARMYHCVDRLLPEQDDLAQDLDRELRQLEGAGQSSVAKVSGEICYAAGKRLYDLMVERCYTDKNTLRRGLSSSEAGALKDLAAATNEEARHPALRGVGMAGHQGRVFHVWPIGADQWSPYPITGEPFVILRPYWHTDDNQPSMKLTFWSADSNLVSPSSRLDDEALHWRFA